MMLKLDEQGRVTDCSILRSSGFAVLDAASCNIMRRRARFDPSRDASGTPVAGFIAQSVDWGDEVFRRVGVIRGIRAVT